MENMRRHARILMQLARIGAIRKSQLRVEFWSQVVMDSIWYALHVAVFWVLYQKTDAIAGWSRSDVRVFLGFLFMSDAFMMMWLGQAWWFGRDLKDGNLDPVRVRPASPIVVYFFKSFSLEATVNMGIAASYLGYAVAQAHVPWQRVLFGLPLGLAIAWWGRTVLVVLFSIFEFYLLHSDMGQFLNEFTHAVEDRPLDVFPSFVKGYFTFVLPVAALCYIPSSLVLGKMGPLAGLLHSAWLVAFGLCVFAAWKRGFRRYESAMG